MKKILILALLLSSLFANDKFSNLANAANSVVKNDEWTASDHIYRLGGIGNKEFTMICLDNEVIVLDLIDKYTNKKYSMDFLNISINNKEEKKLLTSVHTESSELNIHNLNYFLNELPNAKSISIKAGNEIFNFNPVNYKDMESAFEACYIKSPSKEKQNIQTNNQVSESKDFWETGWHQGNSMYHISNKNNDRLEMVCNYERGSIDLIDSNDSLGGLINVIFDNKRKIITPTYISIDDRTSSADSAWENFLYGLQNSNHFVIEAQDGKKYTFEPVNSKEVLSHIVSSCTEYINGNYNQTSEQDNAPASTRPENPMDIFVKTNKVPKNALFEIYALDNNLTINNVIVNGGKCETDLMPIIRQNKIINRKPNYPLRLEKFDSLEVMAWECRHIMEIQIETNYGSYFYNIK